MAILVSPGVSVSVTDESQYGSAGPGTVPLLIIATASNKIQPGSTTTIASGTTKANAGKLFLVTSQRDALQTFGNPTFYSAAGSVQYDNELNELGLFTLYEYLGIANTAYVIRADVDLGQLIPSTVEPSGPTLSGQYWLDLNHTTWGIFRSNGNINSAFSWKSQTPLVIRNEANLQRIVQGYAVSNRVNGGKIVSGSAPCIYANGALEINGTAINLTTTDSISSIVSKINSSSSLQLMGISAEVYTRTEKYTNTASAYGDVCSLRIMSSDYMQNITLTGSTSGILTDLGFPSNAEPTNFVTPIDSFGAAGNYAINTMQDANGDYSNEIWEKITLSTSISTKDWWFKVGSSDTSSPDAYVGWGWVQAVPTVVNGSIGDPQLTSGTSCTITIGSGSPLTVSVTGTSVTQFAANINAALNASSGTNAVATTVTKGPHTYLQLINFDGTSISVHDVTTQSGAGTPWATSGVVTTNTYWGSVTGTVQNPTYAATTLEVASATPVTAGSGYQYLDSLTIATSAGGVGTQAKLIVQTLQAVGVTIANGGTNYIAGDTITIGTGNSHFATPIILTVTSPTVTPGPITGVTITQAGQYGGENTPSNPLSGISAPSGSNATFNISWGVNTVSVDPAHPGAYSTFPNNPAGTTGGSGDQTAAFSLTSAVASGDAFIIQIPGQTPVLINVPVNNTVSGVRDAINNSPIGVSYIPAGPMQASVVNSCLSITNTNGTSFILGDVHGTPLEESGIASGVTFGRKLTYYNYSTNLQVPSDLASLAANNVWINTSPQGLGANFVLKVYQGGQWVTLNSTPNTGTVPMYSSTAAADVAFGGTKQLNTVFVEYNSDADVPAQAMFNIQIWANTLSGPQWQSLAYTPSLTAPLGSPADGTLWYNPNLQVDIMVNTGTAWTGYRKLYPATDINGPILSSAQPILQSTGAPLVDYDIWVNTEVTPYPAIYRYSAASASWVQIDNTDHQTSAGIIFADARSTSDGTTSGSSSITELLVSTWVDPDAPNAKLHPPRMLLFNTRYSTYNVKKYMVNYFPQNKGTAYPTDIWVTASGNAPDGTPYMGPAAQRAVIVDALNAALVDSTDARAEQNFFNLIATPGYTECIAEMVTLNTDKNNIAFVIGDSPSTLPATGTAIQNWATNAANAAADGPTALITASPYVGVWYPWGITSNLDGNKVVVPPSLVALTTIAYSDTVSYPWFPPAGFNRGLVSVVDSVGYLDAYGDYIPVTLNQGQRDVIYSNHINPIAYMPGRGLVVWGQITLDPETSALNRINVVRLVNYLAYNLDNLAKPFLFELNDDTTRANVLAVFNSYLQNLVSQRALYDFAVICDKSNNTATRIDQNQLWIDIAIKPEKAIEFIYIPIRVLSTGAPLPGGHTA